MKKYEPHRFPKRPTRQKTKVGVFYKKYEISFLNDVYEKITEFEIEETGFPRFWKKFTKK